MTSRATTNQPILSRRNVLRAAASTAVLVGAARAIRVLADDDEPFDPGGRVRMEFDETRSWAQYYNYPLLLGRVEARALRVHTKPEDRSQVETTVYYGRILPIYRAVEGTPPSSLTHNPIWFETDRGYVHSSWVIPTQEFYNDPIDWVGPGFWGEITVPTSWQHWQPKLRSRRYYDLAYGSVFFVLDRVDETDGRAWYRLLDDAHPSHQWWVQATHVRKLYDRDFAPVSPATDPTTKWIEVAIGQQTLTCFEAGQPVFVTRIASGTTFIDSEGKSHSFHTPYGEHRVQRKTPSRHMMGGEDINDAFDLPGVPWCTFFTTSGAAIHGTYWHNDYGRARSHGCINVTPDAARWIYRWVTPFAGYDDAYLWTEKTERLDATVIRVEH